MEEPKNEETRQQEVKQVKNKTGKRRMKLVISFIVLVLIIAYANFRGEFLEILEISESYTDIFWQNLKYNGIAIAINFVILFIILYTTNNGIKKGLKPFFDQEKKDMPKLPNKSLAFVISILVSCITAELLKNKALLVLANTKFGINDPMFGWDISYFMFQKPFIELIIFYLIAIVIGTTIYSVAHYIIAFNVFFDGIDRQTLKKSRLMKKMITNIKILSILVAVLIVVNSQNVVFDRMITLDDDDSTVIYGAGLTDTTIKYWGYNILAVVIVIAVFRAMKYLQEKATKKIILSLAIVPEYLLTLLVVMLVFQAVFVNPNELDKEKENIASNIENTKRAYGINIDEIEVSDEGTITEQQVEENRDTIDNVAILNKDVTLSTLKDKQTSSKYYTYVDTQIGKYMVDGEEELVYISPREISNSASTTYNNKTYEQTHGYGAVITSATDIDKTGSVQYIQKSFDGSDNKINIEQPRIYFGMETKEPVVVNSKNKEEFDYPKSETENATNVYDGTAGLKVSFFDRLILGIKQKNIKLALSSDVTSESKILINRNILQRVKKIMPYLIYDQNPYQVITDEGRLVWVIDGYTVSSKYPYSQESYIDVEGTRQKINYIRNSVKVIVDSYDGTVKFYITDRTDPIIMAYNSIYPSLFQDKDEPIPQDIAQHFVYPEFLFNIQSIVLERYHNVKTDVLYRSSDVWNRATHTASKTLKTTGTEIEPFYTMVKTIDNSSAELGLVLPYTMYEKQSLIAYLVGICDSNGNSKLTLYKYSADSNILGPMQLDTQIEQDEEISKEIQSLNVTGTKLIRNIILVPINNSLLYIEPIYQVALNDESDIPILKKVIVASGNKVAIGDTYKEALTNLTSQNAIDIVISNTEDLDGLIDAIVIANQNLEKSNRSNDWEQIGKDMATLQSLINKLEVLMQEQEDTDENGETEEILNTVENNVTENIMENTSI